MISCWWEDWSNICEPPHNRLGSLSTYWMWLQFKAGYGCQRWGGVMITSKCWCTSQCSVAYGGRRSTLQYFWQECFRNSLEEETRCRILPVAMGFVPERMLTLKWILLSGALYALNNDESLNRCSLTCLWRKRSGQILPGGGVLSKHLYSADLRS